MVTALLDPAHTPNAWTLRSFLRPDHADLLPVVLRLLLEDEDDSTLSQWLTTLSATAIRPHLHTLVADPRLITRRPVRTALRRAAPLPLDIALVLVPDNLLAEGFVVAPIAATQAGVLTTTLGRLSASQVRLATPSLYRLRDIGAEAMDAAVAVLAASDDVLGAAWLRSGLPLQAGLTHLYQAAATSAVPARRLVAAALALKEERMDAGAFLSLVTDLPPECQEDAGRAASKYLAGKLADQGATVARVLAMVPARHLSAWLPLVSPDAAIEAALGTRLRDPATAELLAPALADRLRRDRDRWLPVLRRLAPQAAGRLDWLLP